MGEEERRKGRNRFVLVFELGKTLNVDKKSFVLVVNEFWDCVEVVLYCWLGLVWIGFV